MKGRVIVVGRRLIVDEVRRGVRGLIQLSVVHGRAYDSAIQVLS